MADRNVVSPSAGSLHNLKCTLRYYNRVLPKKQSMFACSMWGVFYIYRYISIYLSIYDRDRDISAPGPL